MRGARRKLLTALFVLTAAGGAASAAAERVLEDFESGTLGPHWEEKVFQGKTDYAVVREDSGNHVLRAQSRRAASGLIRRIEYDLREFPVLAWRWKIEHTVAGGDETRKEGDDYAARVYVIFPHWFPPKTKSLNYIWANRLPKGSHIPNAFYGNAVMVAVQSGGDRSGEWVAERRNVLEDYRGIFGEEPSRVGAIAIMTDTDNTGESAAAWYDDLVISRN